MQEDVLLLFLRPPSLWYVLRSLCICHILRYLFFRCKEPLKVLLASLRHYWEVMGALGKELGDWRMSYMGVYRGSDPGPSFSGRHRVSSLLRRLLSTMRCCQNTRGESTRS